MRRGTPKGVDRERQAARPRDRPDLRLLRRWGGSASGAVVADFRQAWSWTVGRPGRRRRRRTLRLGRMRRARYQRHPCEFANSRPHTVLNWCQCEIGEQEIDMVAEEWRVSPDAIREAMK